MLIDNITLRTETYAIWRISDVFAKIYYLEHTNLRICESFFSMVCSGAILS